MTISFTLGLGQVQNELVLLQLPGCYWITVNRQEDARLLVRQVIATQRALILISTAEKPETLLMPAPQGEPNKITIFPLPETSEALQNLTEDLSHALVNKPQLVIFYTAFSSWEKLSQAELINWLKEMQKWLAARKSTLLIITSGSGINNLRNELQTLYRHLEGLSHLEWQQDSWNYRVNWWCSKSGMLADRELRLSLLQDSFIQLNESGQNTPLALNDEYLYLAEKNVLEGAPSLSSAWTLFDDNNLLASRAQQASAATVIFNLHHNDQIATLAGDIHNLRRTRGSGLKIVVREMQTALRYSDERLLLACGVNAIVPYNVSVSRFLTTLEGLQGQRYNRHVPDDLTILLKSMQPLQEKGYLPVDHFCRSVTRLINNTMLPEDGKGLLIGLRPVPQLGPEQALALCKPRRYGDLVTHTGDRLYLFLSSCCYTDLNTALQYIFRLPLDEIFTHRLVWFEDVQILAEVQQIAELAPGDWRDTTKELEEHPPSTELITPAVRLVPDDISLKSPPDKEDSE
ncbi:cellulose biosynthesis protein BcsE [Erwinia sorbitola]|uniref:Cellulose biosynthesis protein BcsE n=1 Tax=Erwinia sorbitola TaxID=2681984 RepID=A0A6I6EHC6_9GAMM|nr:cellulose biosynthesis protein BcsE [Erwinia sorbitola]QGU85786.1 cellulose biosynthesis protein BcsE [Erwinia sorbitola]